MESVETHSEIILDTANEKTSILEIPFFNNIYQYLTSENCERQNLCRICLAGDSKELFPLFTSKDSGMLADMFKELKFIQVDYEDGLPNQICLTCQTLIVQCYEFKLQCEKADYTLKALLRGEIAIKQEENFKDNRIIEESKVHHDGDVAIKAESQLSQSVPTHFVYAKCLENETENDQSSVQQILYVIKNDSTSESNNIEVSEADSKALLNQLMSNKGGRKRKKQKSYQCSTCTKNFTKLSSLKDHRKIEHNIESQLHSCDHCSDLFNSEHDLILHLSLHIKGPPWKCSECKKEFNGRNQLRRHIKRHMESKKYSCSSCSKTFAELCALRRHVRVHTGEIVEKKHACHLCDKRYTESNALANHLKRHSGDRPCVCATCGKTFPNQRLLVSHALVHSDKKLYACNYCDKRFRHESTRNTHQRLHTGEKPYVCSTCGKTFVQASNLTLHMRTHTGERPYPCSDCGRRFTSGSSLKAHLRTHTGERPFACNICGKSFARQNLRAHMKQHSGEKLHECSVCGKKLINAARLREHIRTHTGEKPFECILCPRKFPTKAYLTSHMKTHNEKKKKVERKILITQNRQIADNLKSTETVEEQLAIDMNEEILIQDNSHIETNILIVDHTYSTVNELNSDGIPLNLNLGKELIIEDDNNIETNILVVDHTEDNNSLNSGTVHIL